MNNNSRIFTILLFAAGALSVVTTQRGCSCATTASNPRAELMQEIMKNHPDGIPEPLLEFMTENREFRNSRVIRLSDFGSDYQREWFAKLGYTGTIEDDFEKDGSIELAAVMFDNGKARLLILKRGITGWEVAFKTDLPGPAMIKVSDLGMIGGGKCILGATSQRAARFGFCWDGTTYVPISP